MTYKVIDSKNRIVKIECSMKEYLDGSLNMNIAIARRMMANKVVVEINNKQ